METSCNPLKIALEKIDFHYGFNSLSFLSAIRFSIAIILIICNIVNKPEFLVHEWIANAKAYQKNRYQFSVWYIRWPMSDEYNRLISIESIRVAFCSSESQKFIFRPVSSVRFVFSSWFIALLFHRCKVEFLLCCQIVFNSDILSVSIVSLALEEMGRRGSLSRHSCFLPCSKVAENFFVPCTNNVQIHRDIEESGSESNSMSALNRQSDEKRWKNQHGRWRPSWW